MKVDAEYFVESVCDCPPYRVGDLLLAMDLDITSPVVFMGLQKTKIVVRAKSYNDSLETTDTRWSDLFVVWGEGGVQRFYMTNPDVVLGCFERIQSIDDCEG